MFFVNEDFKTFIRCYPITTGIVGICSILTIIITCMGGFTEQNLILFGAYESDLVNEGQVWRLFTYAFLHSSYQHFFLNMMVTILFARPLERMLGKGKFLVSYLFLCLFAGIIIHFVSAYRTPSEGSSGADYGLWGMYLYLMIRYREQFPSEEKRMVLAFIVLGLIITLVVPHVSLSGHVGGLIGAFLVFRKAHIGLIKKREVG